MDVLIKTMPQDDLVYKFLDKKRVQSKPYYVYMTAGANKFSMFINLALTFYLQATTYSASLNSYLTFYLHTLQTAFPLHQDYALHDIHQTHCNRKSDLQT